MYDKFIEHARSGGKTLLIETKEVGNLSWSPEFDVLIPYSGTMSKYVDENGLRHLKTESGDNVVVHYFDPAQ